MRSLSSTLAVSTLAAALSFPVAGCGDTTVRVQLRRLDTDRPFDGLATLSVVLRDADEIVSSSTQPFDGTSIELEFVPRRNRLTFDVFGSNADDQITARGSAELEPPSAGNSCCVIACFCSLSVSDGGDCNCGSEGCTDTCEP